MKTAKQDQIKNYAAWIWRNKKTDIRRIAENNRYAIGETNESGSVIEWLTPFYEIPALLAYLQGVHAVINAPERFK